MRELKFRAWNEADKCWYAPQFIEMNLLGQAILSHGIEQFEIIPASAIEQYTGLKDKNGKKIYEGDILDVSSVFVEPKKMVVEFSEMACGFEPFVNGCPDCYVPRGKDVAVIGNIHENPELVGGEE